MHTSQHKDTNSRDSKSQNYKEKDPKCYRLKSHHLPSLSDRSLITVAFSISSTGNFIPKLLAICIFNNIFDSLFETIGISEGAVPSNILSAAFPASQPCSSAISTLPSIAYRILSLLIQPVGIFVSARMNSFALSSSHPSISIGLSHKSISTVCCNSRY